MCHMAVTSISTFSSIITQVILYCNLVPISLYVTIELQRLVCALQIGWDPGLTVTDLEAVARLQPGDSGTKDAQDQTEPPHVATSVQGALARNSDLNEELALVTEVFADKTGTLTENKLEFRQCAVPSKRFYTDRDLIEELVVPADSAELRRLFWAVVVCHTVDVTPSKPDGPSETGPGQPTKYTAVSEDEIALVEAAASSGVGLQLTKRTVDRVELLNRGRPVILELIHMNEFTTERMRMSVLIAGVPPDDQVPTSGAGPGQGQIYTLYCKGADIAVIPLLTNPVDATVAGSQAREFGRAGLRTLVMAWRTVTQTELDAVDAKIAAAVENGEDRRTATTEAYLSLESGLTLLGVTAVEDSIQEGAADAIAQLRNAGCKIWVLTGDQLENAAGVSFAVGHTTAEMTVLEAIGAADPAGCRTLLRQFLAAVGAGESVTTGTADNEARLGPSEQGGSDLVEYALHVDGITATTAMSHCRAELKLLTARCTAVLICRLAPSQKALLVAMARESPSAGLNGPDGGWSRRQSWLMSWLQAPRRSVAVAIGDGANDVAMLMQADIGVAVFGREGRHAVQVSDFAVPQFRGLARLLFVHGHTCHYRIG